MPAPEIQGLTLSVAEISDAGGGTTVVIAPAVAGKRVYIGYLEIAKGTLDVSLLAEFGTTHQIANTAYQTGLLHVGLVQIMVPVIGPPGLALRVTATSSSALHLGHYAIHWTYI